MRGSEFPYGMIGGVLVFFFIFIPLSLSSADEQSKGPARAVKESLAAGRLDRALGDVLRYVRASPGEKEPWELAEKVFNACIAAGRDKGLMDAAVNLTETLGGHAGPWILLGKVYLGQAGAIRGLTGFEGMFRQDLLFQAAESFRNALKRDPSSFSAGDHLAFTLFLRNDLSGARKEAEAVLGKHPGDGYAPYLIGEADIRLGRADSALEMFRRSFGNDPGMIDALSGEVRALVALGKADEARGPLMDLARKDPMCPEICDLAFSLFEKKERYLDAAALYRGLLALAPGRQDILFRLAVVEYDLDQLDSSMGRLEEILSRNPLNEGAAYFRGLIFEKRRHFDDAVKSYLSVLSVQGRYFESIVYRLRALAYAKAFSGRLEEAVAIYGRLTALLPFDTTLHANKALALAQCGRIKEAEKTYRRILEIAPRDSRVLNDYALFLMGIGRISEGLENLEKAYAEDGNLDSCENLGAYYYYVRGDLDRAAHYFNLVLRADPFREKSLVLSEGIMRRRAAEED